MAPVSDSIVNDKPKNSHFRVVPAANDEVSSYDLCHGSLSLPAVLEYAFAEGGFVGSSMSEYSMLGKVLGVIPGRHVEAIVNLEGGKRSLFL